MELALELLLLSSSEGDLGLLEATIHKQRQRIMNVTRRAIAITLIMVTPMMKVSLLKNVVKGGESPLFIVCALISNDRLVSSVRGNRCVSVANLKPFVASIKHLDLRYIVSLITLQVEYLQT